MLFQLICSHNIYGVCFLGCGGLLHADRGVISSPHYPQNYKPNLDCSWHVMVTPGYRVSVNFLSPFQVQGFGTACSTGDYLEVRSYLDKYLHAPSEWNNQWSFACSYFLKRFCLALLLL